MTLDIASILGYIILPLVTASGSHIINGLFRRIAVLEDKMQHTTSEPQVRQLIQDKYDPLAQDIRDIKEKLDKLFDLYLQDNKK